MADRFDLLVVGGGVFGLGTAVEAARRGRSVVVVERGPLPNPVAASFGPSRKIRSTYTEPHYAMLAREAMTAWRQIERETGSDLYLAVGNLSYTALDEQPHLDDLEAICRGIGAPIERLDRSEVRARYPQFRLAKQGLLEQDAGFVRASACIEALRVLAERAGATIAAEREVTAIDLDGPDVVAVTASGERFAGERAVVSLGGWSKRLLPELADVLVQTKQGIMYLAEVPGRSAGRTYLPGAARTMASTASQPGVGPVQGGPACPERGGRDARLRPPEHAVRLRRGHSRLPA